MSRGDTTLAATVALPRWGDGPFPAVVVHGSGRVTRRNFRAYGGQLVPQGMVVLFYDKRGVGESTGRYRPFRVTDCESLIRELASDVLAAVGYLKERKDVDADRIGLVGGSQAGWVMPLAASQSDDIAFIINMSGPAVTCGQVDYYQQLTKIKEGHSNHTIKIYPHGDHDLHHATTGRLLDPLPDIRTWLQTIEVLRQ